MSDELGKEFWEEQYGRQHAAGHGRRPHAQLVSAVADLPAGRALDAGCGHGADTIWLATRGWRVTGVDFVGTALSRARDRAASLDEEVRRRIRWVEADLTRWRAEESYDLVSCQYVHLPAAPRQALFARLAGAVAPGGTLLVAGHHPAELEGPAPRGTATDLYLAADQVTALLDRDRWDVLVSEVGPRDETDHHGHAHSALDTIVQARRRS